MAPEPTVPRPSKPVVVRPPKGGMTPVRKPRKMRVMLLETHLDADLRSDRSESRFLKEFFENFGELDFIANSIHSRADLSKFLDHARERRRFDVIQIVAHGRAGKRGTSIGLTDGESLDLRRPETRKIFADLRADALFLSCCQLGKERGIMTDLLRVSTTGAVFSYADDVTDYQAFLVEAIFYHLACGFYRGTRSDLEWREVYERVKFGADYFGIDDGKKPLVEPLLVAEFAGDLED
jgi:hypothetical protein